MIRSVRIMIENYLIVFLMEKAKCNQLEFELLACNTVADFPHFGVCLSP